MREAIAQGGQYACVENGSVLGAFVLNDNPGGNYEAGDWRVSLKRGEFLVIHTLAVAPSAGRRGVGGYMVDCCTAIARRKGYRAIRLDVVLETSQRNACIKEKVLPLQEQEICCGESTRFRCLNCMN